MLRFLSVNTGKNAPLRKASEDMTRGSAITINHANDTAGKATASTGIFLVDVAPNYDGVNAVISPNDASFENISEGDIVITIPTYEGERYATTEVAAEGLTEGDPVVSSEGKFVAATTGDDYEWVFDGEYSDPTGLSMFIVERVARATVS